MKKQTKMTVGTLALVVALVGGAANAAPSLITSQAGYTGPGLDLSAYANGMYNFTFGPIIVDDFTFDAIPGGGGNSGQGSVVGQGGYGLAANGGFGGSAVYIGVDSGTGSARLRLNSGPVSQLGFFMNYAPGAGNPATISALDINGVAFASFDLTTLAPISTPGGFNEFAFRGISDSSASIHGLQFGGNYILVTGSADGTAAPRPPASAPDGGATLGMLGLALAGMAGFRRKFVA